MNSMVEHLLNQNLPDHERLGVTPAAQPAEVREAVARLRRALLDPHLTDHFRQQGQSILSDLAPRIARRSSASDCGSAAAGSGSAQSRFASRSGAAFDRLRPATPVVAFSRRFSRAWSPKNSCSCATPRSQARATGQHPAGPRSMESDFPRTRFGRNQFRVGVAEHITAF